MSIASVDSDSVPVCSERVFRRLNEYTRRSRRGGFQNLRTLGPAGILRTNFCLLVCGIYHILVPDRKLAFLGRRCAAIPYILWIYQSGAHFAGKIAQRRGAKA